MADETTGESRVSMNWPNELKMAVRELVGSRGLTDFTLAAVREKLARDTGKGESTAAAAPAEVDPSVAQAPVPTDPMTGLPPTPVEPVPDPTFDNPITVAGEPVSERGEAVKVDAPPTLGVAARFNSSEGKLQEVMDKARALGIKPASEITSSAVAAERTVQPEYIDPPGPQQFDVVEDVIQPSLPSEPEGEPEVAHPPTPDPVPAAPSRDLDDIDAGF